MPSYRPRIKKSRTSGYWILAPRGDFSFEEIISYTNWRAAYNDALTGDWRFML